MTATNDDYERLVAGRDLGILPGDEPTALCAVCAEVMLSHEPRRPRVLMGPLMRLVCDKCGERLDAEVFRRVEQMRAEDAERAGRMAQLTRRSEYLRDAQCGAQARLAELEAELAAADSVPLPRLVALASEIVALAALQERLDEIGETHGRAVSVAQMR